MTFGDAIEHMIEGQRMTRPGWNGTGMYVELQDPDENSRMGQPYIYIRTVDGTFVPWTPSQTDMLAMDWELAP